MFDEDIPYGLDWDMWIRISKEFHLEWIEEPLVKYYIHENNRLSVNHELVIAGLEARLKKYGHVWALSKKWYSTRYSALGVHYCYSGNTKKGRDSFLRAIKVYPFEIRHYFNFCLSLLGANFFIKVKEIKKNVFNRGEI